MTRGRRSVRPQPAGALVFWRRRAEAAKSQLRRVAMKEIRALEERVARLSAEREQLLAEIGVRSEGRSGATSQASRGRRVDWERVFTRLPKTSFSAGDVKRMVPQVAGGTLSLRLTKWVKEKKLKRSGTRRGTRYVRSA